MTMEIESIDLTLPALTRSGDCIAELRGEVERQLERQGYAGRTPLRFAMVESTPNASRCEVEVCETGDHALSSFPSVFDYRQRTGERTGAFNAAMLIPTGVDCEIGGHAGDATPAARLLSSVCDNLIIHPNVVNASDVNEQSQNCLYAEGSVITRLLMGTVALKKVRSNRILVVTEPREDGPWAVDHVVNTASAARANLGADVTGVVVLGDPIHMKMAVSKSGRATGQISGIEEMLQVLKEREGTYDAVAIASKITPSADSVALHHAYFSGEGVNPWGGVEAALTHAVSTILNVPSAHAPTMSDLSLRTQAFGRVEPRKAAEIISVAYFYCVMKGLHQAPRVVPNPTGAYDPSLVSAEDVSALVIPDGCVGLPTVAAVQQGIPVIAVNNKNLMKNDLQALPFRAGQLIYADSYLEAAGILTAMKHGVAISSVRRPLEPTLVEVLPSAKATVTPATKSNGVPAPKGKTTGKRQAQPSIV